MLQTGRTCLSSRKNSCLQQFFPGLSECGLTLIRPVALHRSSKCTNPAGCTGEIQVAAIVDTAVLLNLHIAVIKLLQ